MSRLLDLADAYAVAVMAQALPKAQVTAVPTEARAALAAEVEKLEAEYELVGKSLRSVVEQHKELLAERDALREKLAAVEKDAARLWMLLDDVDTADDIAKGSDSMYRGLCQAYQAKRWEIMSGDRIDAAMGDTK